MRNIATTNQMAIGSVGHHAGHVIGTDDDGNPIYCSGHTVSATFTSAAKLRVSGVPVLFDRLVGATNCPCDHGPATIKAASKLRVSGRSVAATGDTSDFHGAGSGRFQSGTSKLRVR